MNKDILHYALWTRQPKAAGKNEMPPPERAWARRRLCFENRAGRRQSLCQPKQISRKGYAHAGTKRHIKPRFRVYGPRQAARHCQQGRTECPARKEKFLPKP